jgi:hypothetical protein
MITYDSDTALKQEHLPHENWIVPASSKIFSEPPCWTRTESIIHTLTKTVKLGRTLTPDPVNSLFKPKAHVNTQRCVEMLNFPLFCIITLDKFFSAFLWGELEPLEPSLWPKTLVTTLGK